jgi:TetR/AcrR family transcriptional regulator, cholesterol catabolism regulator
MTTLGGPEVQGAGGAGIDPLEVRGQGARRRRVLAAAMELAGEGGYDAVQMRDVAVRAQVALGTIYRYFSSKDQLLAAALVDWASELEHNLAEVPPRGARPVDRLLDVVHRVSRLIERSPRLTAALVTAISGPDPAVVAAQQDMSRIIVTLLREPLGGLEPVRRDRIVRVLDHVWFSAILGWVNGWAAVTSVGQELEDAVLLLLGDDGDDRDPRSALDHSEGQGIIPA